MAKFAPVSYVNSVIDEGKKTVWPNRTTVIRHTIMVIATLTVATLIFAGVNYLLQLLLVSALTK